MHQLLAVPRPERLERRGRCLRVTMEDDGLAVDSGVGEHLRSVRSAQSVVLEVEVSDHGRRRGHRVEALTTSGWANASERTAPPGLSFASNASTDQPRQRAHWAPRSHSGWRRSRPRRVIELTRTAAGSTACRSGLGTVHPCPTSPTPRRRASRWSVQLEVVSTDPTLGRRQNRVLRRHHGAPGPRSDCGPGGLAVADVTVGSMPSQEQT